MVQFLSLLVGAAYRADVDGGDNGGGRHSANLNDANLATMNSFWIE